MARLIGDQLEQDEPQLAGVEHAPAAAAAPAATAATPFVTAPAAKATAEAPAPAAPHAHGDDRLGKPTATRTAAMHSEPSHPDKLLSKMD